MLGGALLDDVPGLVLRCEEEGATVGHAVGLLHVVGHDHDGHLVAQLGDGVLDAAGRRRVEGRTRLVHQQHVGLHGQGPGDAEPLLLPTRQRAARRGEAVPHLAPQSGPDERLLDEVGLLRRLDAGQLEAGEDVVADAHGRERVGLLEHHADAHADLLGPHAGPVDVLAVEEHLAGERGARHQLVHAVEQPEEGRLAASGRADERGDVAGRHLQVDPLEHEVVAEPSAGVAGLERRRPGRRAAEQLDRWSTRQRVGVDDLGRRRGDHLGERVIGLAGLVLLCVGRAGDAAGAVVAGTVGHGEDPSWRATIGAPGGGRASSMSSNDGAGAPCGRPPGPAARAVAPDEPGDCEQDEHDDHEHSAPVNPRSMAEASGC